MRRVAATIWIVILGFPAGPGRAQQWLPTMPGYDQYKRMQGEMPGAIKYGAVSVEWKDGGKALEFTRENKRYRFDFAGGKVVEVSDAGQAETPPLRGRLGGGAPGRGRRRSMVFLERGRQETTALAPDGKRKAFYRDRNLWLSDPDGKNEIPVTTDGSEKTRIKYATASWVYGEELEQRTAMWWSPDSRKIAFYRFDESKVPDYYLELHNLDIQSKMDIEPYPKAGAPNPIVDLYVYDLASKTTAHADVRDGKPFENGVVGHYVYGFEWSPDGKELLFHRTNRRQNILELTACDPETGKCRVVVREEWPASWTDNSPAMQFLKDGHRFLWTSARNSWHNLYLYDLSGKLLNPITQHAFEVTNVVRVDEDAGLVYYMASDGDNPLKEQLHRVHLDGTGDRRLTDPALFHSVDIAPDGKHFLDVAQTHDMPPVTRVLDAGGNVIKVLAESDLSKFQALGMEKAELFTFPAADGTTMLYGILQKPSHFDPNKKYPLLVRIYSGPETTGAEETFVRPTPLTELGFLVASFDARGGSGRGKKFMDAIYEKLGVVEIDDQAAGVRFLRQRPYVDGSRVGIFGTSYGGYASVMCLLRYPDVFQAACAGSSVTDWRNYDSVYTERYMWIPEENKDGYDAGSAMTYAKNLQGHLMLYYGTADNNVHPSNTLQLVQALQREDKSFDVQVGPDQGHSGVRYERMLEFFVSNLILRK